MLGFAKAKEMAADINRNGAELTAVILQLPEVGNACGQIHRRT